MIILVGVIIALVALAALVALRGLIVMWLWNWLMPMVFGLPELSFIESIGMVLLATFLFGTMFDRGSLSNAKGSKKD